MEFSNKISEFASRIKTIQDTLKTEEAVKTSIVMPFFQLLGYDIFNPYEFVPEFTADTGTKKGEKVDYAIVINGEPTILVEAKALDKDLNKHTNQLYRYFSVTKAKFAILTNGIIYKFYTDLEEPNIMDEVPFLELNLLNLNDASIEQLKKFSKNAFDIQCILDTASDLKYTAMIKKVLAEQLANPSDQFVKLILGKGIYTGVKTQAVIDKFKSMIQLSFNQYISDLVNDRIKSALNEAPTFASQTDIIQQTKKESDLTSKELSLLDAIKRIISSALPNEDFVYKKTERYLSIQLGNNSRKWICRVFLKQNTPHTFQLHQVGDTPYDCEYLFEGADQLNQISSLITDVAKKCQQL